MTDLPAMRQPKQDRSRVALERLMAASREILHEGTFELLTIAEISKRSGVSVGSIYARFGGKEDLFIAVMMEVMQELDAEWQQLIQQLHARNLPLRQRLPALMDVRAEYLRRHAGILRPFMARADDERVAGIGKAAYQKMSRPSSTSCSTPRRRSATRSQSRPPASALRFRMPRWRASSAGIGGGSRR